MSNLYYVVAFVGDEWTYALIFELVAPLRNKMMYHPGDLNAIEWAKYTKAFVDCKVKDEDEAGDHGTAYSVDNVYSIMKNPAGEWLAILINLNITNSNIFLVQGMTYTTTFCSS